jgi:hypothetical protein
MIKVTYKGEVFKCNKVSFNISNELGVCVFLQGEHNTLLEGVEIGKLVIENDSHVSASAHSL